jgi:hypothetical protein
MIATSHMIIGGAVGLAVGSITQNPLVALAAGFVSHLICDTIPHFDHPPAPKVDGELVWTPAVWLFAFADSFIALSVTLFLWYRFFDFPLASAFVMGAIGGYLPDFIDNVPFWKNSIRTLPGFKQFHNLHEWVHSLWTGRYPMPRFWLLGTLTQLIFVGFSLWYLFAH